MAGMVMKSGRAIPNLLKACLPKPDNMTMINPIRDDSQDAVNTLEFAALL
jgi:hypothetical protein